jgi:hypothetical protein
MALHRLGDTGVAGRVNARLERRGRDVGGDVFRLALQVALGVDPDPEAVRGFFDALEVTT